MDSSAIGMCLVSPEGGFLTVNPALCAMLGRDADALIASTWQEITHPDDLDVDLALVDDVLCGRIQSYRLLKRYLRPDNTAVWGDLSVSCVRDDDGSVSYFISQIVDVSAQVEAQRAPRQSEARCRAVADSAVDAIVTADLQGVITGWNATAERMFGYAKEDAVGIPVTTLMPGLSAVGHPAVTARPRTGGGGHTAGTVVELEARRRDGSDFPVELSQAEGEESGERFVTSIIRDVTERRDTAEALAESEAQYRLLAENASDVIIKTREGVVDWVSPSLRESLGWSPQDWVGRRLSGLVHADDLESAASCQAVVDAGRSTVCRFRVQAKDATWRWIEVHAKPYLAQEGVLDGAVAAFRTVDAEVAAARELEQRACYDELTGLLNREEAFGQVAAIVGHARRAGQESALLFCDVDEFKSVNDARGHAAGDAVLREVARRVQDSVRAGDVVARVGGDELLVVLDGVRGLDDAVAIAEKIRRAVSRPILVSAGTVTITLSIGATTASPGEEAEALIARADGAMYRAKRSGRDQVVAVNGKSG